MFWLFFLSFSFSHHISCLFHSRPIFGIRPTLYTLGSIGTFGFCCHPPPLLVTKARKKRGRGWPAEVGMVKNVYYLCIFVRRWKWEGKGIEG
ncbi:hypothetical protein QBC41DRAFT_27988 [Cercophora samala]|uniref:Secreted protein n=1 Tax=Cercophora samala TaxID=330535 RepID=A0AA39Z2H8_9PEZI|nr:hypothetical protein QBC41DRAFT_27988 [Cercophora samala]